MPWTTAVSAARWRCKRRRRGGSATSRARRLGDLAGAADLLLRAGRGAAARGEAAEARRWLGDARALAAGGRAREVERQAREAIAALRRP
jgi:hypothetical protein